MFKIHVKIFENTDKILCAKFSSNDNNNFNNVIWPGGVDMTIKLIINFSRPQIS